MEIKILQVFLGEDNLPYKDKERTVHFPIVGAAFKGASNTTKIRFYYDKLVEQDDEDTTTWVAVSKLPNGKIGSKVLESEYDEELGEHYALFELESFYTQYKGDLFISLQGYQGGVQVITDQDTGISQIVGTPTIQATGSIKLAINYATQFIGSGETSNVNFQSILADLGTKLGIRTLTERVDELPTVGQTNVFYVVPDTSDTNKVNIYVWNGTTQSYVWVGDNSLYLGNYYTKQEGQDFEQEIADRIESVASGSPKGVYSTLEDLQTAYPTGTSGIYVVSADGHWYFWNGSAWTDGGQYKADLTIQQKLGQSTTDVMSQKAVTDEILDMNSLSLSRYLINGSMNDDGTWNTSYYSYLIPLNNATKIIIDKSASSSSLICLLSAFNNPSSGDVLSLATGWTGYKTIGGKSIFSVPSNAKYIILYAGPSYSNLNRTPVSLKVDCYEYVNNNSKNIANNTTKINDTNDKISKINERVFVGDGYANGSTWVINTTLHFYLIPVNPGDEIIIRSQETTTAPIIMLSSDEIYAGGTVHYSSGWSEMTINQWDKTIIVPSDGHYLFVYAGSGNRLPSKLLINGYDYAKSLFNNVSTNRDNIEHTNNKLSLDICDKTKFHGSWSLRQSDGTLYTQNANDCFYTERINEDVKMVCTNLWNGRIIVYAFDQNGDWQGYWDYTQKEFVTSGGDITNRFANIDEIRELFPTHKLYIEFYRGAGNAINFVDTVSFISRKSLSKPTKIRFMQYNIGKLNYGTQNVMSEELYQEKLPKYKEFLCKYQPDIIGLQEFVQNVTSNNHNIDESIFDKIFPFKTDIDSQLNLKSKYKMLYRDYSNIHIGSLVTVFMIGHFDICGKNVAVLTTALPYQETADGMSARETALAKAMELLQDEDYAFILCDMNNGGNGSTISSDDECLIRKAQANAAGWDVVNGDYLGVINSYGTQNPLDPGDSHYPIDNILYKANGKIRFSNFEVLKNEFLNLSSDHFPILADLILD